MRRIADFFIGAILAYSLYTVYTIKKQNVEMLAKYDQVKRSIIALDRKANQNTKSIGEVGQIAVDNHKRLSAFIPGQTVELIVRQE